MKRYSPAQKRVRWLGRWRDEVKSHSVPIKDYRHKYGCSRDLAPFFFFQLMESVEPTRLVMAFWYAETRTFLCLGERKASGKFSLTAAHSLGELYPKSDAKRSLHTLLASSR